MARDFFQRFWRPDVDDRGLLRAGRLAAAVGLVIAVIMAIFFPSILLGLSTFYALLVAALAVPLVAGLYSPRTGNRAALLSVVTSLLVAAAATVWTGRSPGPENFWPSVLGIAAGAGVCALVTVSAPRS